VAQPRDALVCLGQRAARDGEDIRIELAGAGPSRVAVGEVMADFA
jgi:hypothetical protein